jgi:talin
MDPSNSAYQQTLSHSTKTLSQRVASLVELSEAQEIHPWVRECDNSLQQIQSIRQLFVNDGAIVIPINQNSYYESLSEVTNEARRLGEGMNGMAHYARRDDMEQLCRAIRSVADAVCGLAQNAAQSAYLIGISDPQSEPGRAALYDSANCDRFIQSLKQLSGEIFSNVGSRSLIIQAIFIVPCIICTFYF